jgi:hypothetical protein
MHLPFGLWRCRCGSRWGCGFMRGGGRGGGGPRALLFESFGVAYSACSAHMHRFLLLSVLSSVHLELIGAFVGVCRFCLFACFFLYTWAVAVGATLHCMGGPPFLIYTASASAFTPINKYRFSISSFTTPSSSLRRRHSIHLSSKAVFRQERKTLCIAIFHSNIFLAAL